MPFSYAQYAGNGSTTTFSVPFPYLLKAHVKLYTGFNILSGAYTSLLVDGTDYTWSSTTQVQTTVAPANGVTLTVLRDTPDSSQLVPWQDGSNLVADDMNIADQQNLYVVQEQQDRNDAGITQSTTAINTANAASATATAAAASVGGKLDKTGGTMTGAIAMSGNKVTGLGEPTVAQDAATKNYTDNQVGVVSASATSAAASASAASTSQAAAAASQAAAAASATNAAASASTAATQATNSSSSAAAAAGSATAAAGSQAAAAGSQSAAAASAATASTQATAAASSATSAASSAASALAAFDSFDDRYLGAKASDPSVDNDGDPLTAGDLYWNTTLSVMKVYTGSAWVIAYVPGDASNISFTPYGTVASSNVQGAVQELVDEKLNLTGGTLTGNLVLNNQNDVRFGEAAANGSNYVAFQAPASIASDVVWTLPATDATVSGHALKSNAAGTLSWGTAGGAAGGGTDDVFYENAQTVTTSYTLTTNKNALSAGPITINAGATVTIPSGQSWSIV
jgi:hypothetical protein